MRTNSTFYTPQNPEVMHKAHVHFFDYLSSFHGLETEQDYSVQNSSIQDKLRNQYLKENNWEDKLCYRTCFKLESKDYVQFCLDKKCSGTQYQKAASILGYAKTGNVVPKQSSQHHH